MAYSSACRPANSLKSSVSLGTLAVALLTVVQTADAQERADELPAINVSSTRLPPGLTGASTTVLTTEDIARSPGLSLQEIIAQVPGAQVRSLRSGANGAETTVDLRGFGATGSSNTLVMINGRRLNDLDMAGVDFAAIPRSAIERIEITRGNSGAVLYGDNAVGGVINIVTKSGSSAPLSMRVEAGVGSFNQRMGEASVSASSGPWSTRAFSSALTSDGYRANSAIQQINGLGELRYTTTDFTAFMYLSGDDQHIKLPGARTVDPGAGIDQLASARRAATTPFDYADKQGLNLTAGFTKTLGAGVELIVDAGIRDKRQQAAYLGSVPLSAFSASYTDAALQTWSITPRLSIKGDVLGVSSDILTGVDFYNASYQSNRGQYRSTAPVHKFDLSQQTVAAYWQQKLSISAATDISYGGRLEHMSLSARDQLNMSAPGYFGDAQALPHDTSEWNHALHVGLEHRLNDVFAVFGRAGRAFRTPNVDERVSSGPSYDAIGNAIPGNFTIKTQTSHDVEAGLRIKAGVFAAQTSLYAMDLTNEIHLDPINFYNTNLAPTRRYGSETSASLQIADNVTLRGALALTRAVFREGPLSGNDVPLVSRLTSNAGVTWNVWQKYLVVDATVRYWSSRWMDNDQANLQRVIPANATVDLALRGEYQKMFWSFSVNNLLDKHYYDYAVASTFTPGRFNAYPLAGRTFLLKVGATF